MAGQESSRKRKRQERSKKCHDLETRPGEKGPKEAFSGRFDYLNLHMARNKEIFSGSVLFAGRMARSQENGEIGRCAGFWGKMDKQVPLPDSVKVAGSVLDMTGRDSQEGRNFSPDAKPLSPAIQNL